MTMELDALRRIVQGLDAVGLPYMLTGSFAMACYTTPRMTRDIDIVVALATPKDAGTLVRELASDFYIDADDVREAMDTERMFNVMHFATSVKIDLIIRKHTPFRRGELARRQRGVLGDVETWIVSREDLILSKLLWARETDSELQRRDVSQLLQGPTDTAYLYHWAAELGVLQFLPSPPPSHAPP